MSKHDCQLVCTLQSVRNFESPCTYYPTDGLIRHEMLYGMAHKKLDQSYFFCCAVQHCHVAQHEIHLYLSDCVNKKISKGLITRSMNFSSHRVVQHHANKFRINPNCVAWCCTMPHNAKFVFRVNRPLKYFFK
jgi:hypothetical protein